MSDRSARFHCVLVALEHGGRSAPIVASGTWDGEIALARRGSGGFGYDPVSSHRALGVTAAELDSATKNRCQPPWRALHALVELRKNGELGRSASVWRRVLYTRPAGVHRNKRVATFFLGVQRGKLHASLIIKGSWTLLIF